MITTVCKISYGSQTVPPIVPAVQGDTGRAISFEIADFTPPAGATATYFILKPSGEAIYNSATITDNSILCELTAQSLAEAGENRMQVRVLQGENIVTSFEVILMVRTFLGDDAIQSGTEMNIFDQAVEQATEQFQTNAEQVVEEVIESIPSDYTALTEEVDELNERLDEKATNYTLLNDRASLFQRKTGFADDAFNPVSSTTRILSYPYLSCDAWKSRTLRITPENGYKWILYEITESGYTVPFSKFAWNESSGVKTLYQPTTLVGLLIAKVDNSTINIDDYDKVKFEVVGDYTETQETVQSLYEKTNGFTIIVLPTTSYSNGKGILYSSGDQTDNVDYVASDYIPVTPGDEYRITAVLGGTNTRATGVVGYDAEKTYVCGLLKSEQDARQLVTGRLIIPDGVYYIRGCSAQSNYANASYPVSPLIIERYNPQSIDARIEKLENNATSYDIRKKLYIGPLTQSVLTSTGIGTASDKQVSQVCAIAVPFYGAKISVKCPSGYNVGIKSGETTTGSYINLSVDSGWMGNGDTYTLSSANQIYRVYFGKNEGTDDITVSEVETLLEIGELALLYEDASQDIATRNFANESYIKNIMRKFTGVLSKDDSLTKMPTFTHMSDIHGDAIRAKSFMDYSDILEVDAALLSGDLVPMSGLYDRVDYINDLLDDAEKPVLLCMGNHDARGLSTKQTQHTVLSHIISKYGLSTPHSETYPTYYYYDFSEKNIRLISLNMYEAGQLDTNKWRWTQEQINWFINTLSSTPANYGVVVMMHAPEETITSVTGKTDFFQNGTVTKYGQFKPITDIIDAFIGKSTLSESFEQPTLGVTETITVTADFSALNTGVEFICYVTGHRHMDGIGYVAGTTHRQLQCNVQLGFALYGTASYHFYAEQSDTARGGRGASQDAFNIYCIDRTTKTVRVARIGSNMSSALTDRKWLIIPYAE